MSNWRTAVNAAAFAAAYAAAGVVPAHAQQAVVVTAARAPQPLAEAPPHTTVLTRDEIERSQAVDLASLLAAEAGVQLSANGGRGTATSLFLRGAPQRQVLVLIDGVPMSRQDATGQVGIEHLMLEQVERVEVVRGNVSALYGSGAVGGVIQIFTRGADVPGTAAFAQAGSRESVNLGARRAGGDARTRWSFGASGVRSSGSSAIDPADVPAANPDRDGYRNATVAADLAHRIADGHSVSLGYSHVDGRLDYDSAFAAASDVQTSRTTKDVLRVASEHRVDARWTTRLALTGQRDDARYQESGSFGFDARYRTDVRTLGWTHEWLAGERTRLFAGVELQRQRIDADDGFGGVYERARSLRALFGSLRSRVGEHDLGASLRVDDVEGAGSHPSGRLDWGWQVAPAWRLVASIANAFAAPPLGYLYAPFFGNPDLQPERSNSVELGAQWATTGQRLRVTGFATRVLDELEYDFASNAFANLARTRNRGLEASYAGSYRATDVRASLTLQRPVDEANGEQRLRRSEVLASVTVSHDLGSGWRVGGAARYAGQRPDAGGVELPAYTVVDLNAQWSWRPGWTLLGRVENVGDARYQTAYGYNQPARGGFVGLRWSPAP